MNQKTAPTMDAAVVVPPDSQPTQVDHPSGTNTGYAYLKIFGPDVGVFEFKLPQRSIVIGRSKTADINLPNRSVSRVHAAIAYTMGKFILTDSGSTSGTTVNGKPFKRHELEHGESIEIATYVLQFRTHPEIPGADDAAARAKLLLRGEYCTPPSTMRLRFRTIRLGSTALFESGDTLKIGQGGLLIPTTTPADDGSCLELEMSITKRINRQFLGELMGIIEEGETNWMCVRLHTVTKKHLDAVLSDATREPWVEVVPT